MNALITATFAALLMSGSATAAQLKKGETACRHEKALVELEQAQVSGDDRTVEWLFNGSVCLIVPEDTEVAVIGRTDDGNQQLRTIDRRRNLTLWASSESTVQR